VVVFFGIAAVAGSHYLQSGDFTASAVLTGLVLGAPAAAVLLVNNVRDLDADRRVGRVTLAVLLGPHKARYLYLLLMFIPFLLLPSIGHPAVVWAAMPALLLFLWLSWRFLRLQGAEWLNAQLAHTAQAQLFLGLLLCIGLLW